jgi:hypothetical protein
MSNTLHTSNGNVRAPHLKHRQHNQAHRVGNGILNGSLNKNELGELRDERRDYRGELKEAKGDDGRVDRGERFALNQDLNAMGESIWAFKHN